MEQAEIIELEDPLSNLDRVESMTNQEIEEYRDKEKGWKLQHVAAFSGHLTAVNKLIKYACDFEEKINGKSATALAFERGHFEVVLNLLQVNYKYPSNFKTTNVSHELKVFVELSQNLHASILEENVQNIDLILSQNPNLKYFYNTQNKSAVSVALKKRKFKSYELLVSRKMCLASHENFDAIVSRLREIDCRKLREIHSTTGAGVMDEPMSTFNKNSSFGPNCPDGQEHRNFISEAYNVLFSIICLKSVLTAVAASRTFRIVYDFSREAVTYIDPTADDSTDGIFYLTGKIFIGALNMLKSEKKFEVFGTIAHEITHFAMYLTYKNFAKPYGKKDKKMKKQFAKILSACLRLRDQEQLISVVFEAYHQDKWPAELIVRVPHMMAKYYNQPDVLKQKKEIFASLFDYFEQICVKDIEKAIPKIQKEFRSKKDKNNDRRKRNLRILSFVFVLFLIVGLPLGSWFWFQSFSWLSLSADQRLKVQDSPIDYLGCEVNFSTIFSQDSDIYFKLTSSEIFGAIWGRPFEFPKTVDKEKEKYVHLNGSNLPECLESKLLNSNVNFQDQNLRISDLLVLNSTLLEYLESTKILQILKGEKEFYVSKKVEEKSKIYVEREFAEEQCLKKRENDANQYCPRLNLSTILTEMSRVFFLSSPAGQGKSTTLRHFGIELKEKWPQKWVEFVDLKKNLKAFEIGNRTALKNPKQVGNFIGKTLLNLTDFEYVIFNQKFQNGNVVFLWDGIDEISPFYKEFLLELTFKYKIFTKNWQFASTRPQHSEEFQKKLKVLAYGLTPLEKEQKIEFLVKYSVFDEDNVNVKDFYENLRPLLNFSRTTEQILTDISNSKAFSAFSQTKKVKILKILQNGAKILTSIEKSDQNMSPLLIEMSIEAAKNDDITNYQNFYNYFLLYDNFLTRKFDITLRKGDIVRKDLDKWIQDETLTYKKVHQVFAVKTLFYLKLSELQNDKKVRLETLLNGKIKNILDKKTTFEISRFGILTVDSDEDFDFVHRTFAEFFAAKFLINNLIYDFTSKTTNELELRFFMIEQVFYERNFEIVERFVTDFFDLKEDKKSIDFAEHLKDHKLRMSKVSEVLNSTRIDFFCRFVDFSHFFESKLKIPKNLIPTLNSRKSYKPRPEEEPDLIPFQLLSSLEQFKEIFGVEKFRYGLKIRDERGNNALLECHNRICKISMVQQQLLKIYSELFNETELKEIVINPIANENILINAVQINSLKIKTEDFQDILVKTEMTEEQISEILEQNSKLDDIETFTIVWNFVKNNLASEHQKTILKMKELSHERSALELSALSKNKKLFDFVKAVYKETLSKKEIKELIFNSNEGYLSSNFFATQTDDLVMCVQISEFLFELFDDDISMLKNLLKRRNREDNTILMEISRNADLKGCIDYYKNKWTKIAENDKNLEKDLTKL